MGIAGGPFYNGNDLVFSVNTHEPATGAASDADSDPTYRIYVALNTTAIVTGTMARLDAANTPAGFYCAVETIDDGAGFSVGDTHTIVVTATVGGVTASQSFNFVVAFPVDDSIISFMTDGSANMSWHTLRVDNPDGGDAVTFVSDSGTGLNIISDSGNAVQIMSVDGIGLSVGSNHGRGMDVFTDDGPAAASLFSDSGYGLQINGAPAVHIYSPNSAGVQVQADNGRGIDVISTNGTGVSIMTTAANAIDIYAASGGDAVHILADGGVGNAVTLLSAGGYGLDIESSATSLPAVRMLASGAGAGLQIANSGTGDGVEIVSNAGNGIDVSGFTTGATITATGTGSGLVLRGATGTRDLDAREITDMMGYTGVGYGGHTLDGMVRLIGSTLFGKSNGLGTTTAHFRDLGDTKNRVTATTDLVGNRSAVTLDDT